MPKPTWDLKPLSYFQKIFDTLEDIKNLINLEPNNENVEREESSFDAFLKLENLRYLELLNGITSQLEGIIKGLKGDVSFNPNMRKVAMLLSRGTIPKSWNRSSKSIPTLTKWIINLKGQIQAIIDYRRRPPAEPVIVHMAVFINKQSMLYNLMIDWSKESGKPVHMMDLSAEVSIKKIAHAWSCHPLVIITKLRIETAFRINISAKP